MLMPAACFSISAPRWAVAARAEGKRLALSVPLLRQRDQFIVPTLSAAGTTTILDAALMRLILVTQVTAFSCTAQLK